MTFCHAEDFLFANISVTLQLVNISLSDILKYDILALPSHSSLDSWAFLTVGNNRSAGRVGPLCMCLHSTQPSEHWSVERFGRVDG